MKAENKKNLKVLLTDIENLARETRKNLRSGKDITVSSSQLTNKIMTYVFTFGASFQSLKPKVNTQGSVVVPVTKALPKRGSNGRWMKE